MKNVFLVLFCIFSCYTLNAQHRHGGAEPISYPDIPGYMTLSTDLHQHTVFSDGHVWPSIRVQEALRENLDAISLTEHLEYQEHKEDIPHPDRNRSYDLALEHDLFLQEEKPHELIIIHGAEITREAPAGHSNAVFITDANKLLAKDSITPFEEAKRQNAFVFWNHPAWYVQQPIGNPVLSEFQKQRIQNGELHGIEVINTFDYSEESLALALEYNLTIMGTSDIHGLIDWDYTEKGHNRPVTLVFAEKKSPEGIKEALFAGRTVAVYNSLMVGKAEYLKPLLQACIHVRSATYLEESQVLEVVLENVSSSDLLFENQMPYTFYSNPPVIEIPAGGSKTLQIKTLEKKERITLALKALKAYTAPKEQPVVEWEVVVQ